MPAKSKSQQRLFGMVHAYQKGELPDASSQVKNMAKSIRKEDVEHFAETRHKGLPAHVKQAFINGFVNRLCRYTSLCILVLALIGCAPIPKPIVEQVQVIETRYIEVPTMKIPFPAVEYAP